VFIGPTARNLPCGLVYVDIGVNDHVEGGVGVIELDDYVNKGVEVQR
jgi:hypothetical protein